VSPRRDTELISVLLPAFNAAATLPLCLRSLQRQTEIRWRCVIVDDGSTDDTAAIACDWARRDSRIEVMRRPHSGLIAALNAGLAACHGQYVARMDTDDWMHRQRLHAQRELLDRDHSLVAAACHVRTFPRAQLTAGWRSYEAWLNHMRCPSDVRRDAFVESPIVHPTLMIRRSALNEFGYRDRRWPEDYDLVLRLLRAGHSIGIVPHRLLGWRDRPERLTRTHPAYSIESLTACRAYFLSSWFLSHTDRYILWGYGGTGRTLCRALREHGKRPEYIIELHPGRIGNQIQGARVVSPDLIPSLPRLPLIASVAGEEARRLIRHALEGMGWTEGRDFVCAA